MTSYNLACLLGGSVDPTYNFAALQGGSEIPSYNLAALEGGYAEHMPYWPISTGARERAINEFRHTMPGNNSFMDGDRGVWRAILDAAKQEERRNIAKYRGQFPYTLQGMEDHWAEVLGTRQLRHAMRHPNHMPAAVRREIDDYWARHGNVARGNRDGDDINYPPGSAPPPPPPPAPPSQSRRDDIMLPEGRIVALIADYKGRGKSKEELLRYLQRQVGADGADSSNPINQALRRFVNSRWNDTIPIPPTSPRRASSPRVLPAASAAVSSAPARSRPVVRRGGKRRAPNRSLIELQEMAERMLPMRAARQRRRK